MRKNELTVASCAGCIIASVLWLWAPSGKAPHRAAHPGQEEDPPTFVLSDGVEIFKRTFWKRPGDEDRIVQAERHKWMGERGLEKWATFLAVDPSSILSHFLIEKTSLA